jgi:hypothetical protein
MLPDDDSHPGGLSSTAPDLSSSRAVPFFAFAPNMG